MYQPGDKRAQGMGIANITSNATQCIEHVDSLVNKATTWVIIKLVEDLDTHEVIVISEVLNHTTNCLTTHAFNAASKTTGIMLSPICNLLGANAEKGPRVKVIDSNLPSFTSYVTNIEANAVT